MNLEELRAHYFAEDARINFLQKMEKEKLLIRILEELMRIMPPKKDRDLEGS